MKKNSEETLQLQICRYLDLQYPQVIYTSDLSGIRLTIGSAVKAKMQRCKRFKIPDLLILKPNLIYNGLIIELKKDKSEVFGVKGQVLKHSRVESQIRTLYELNRLGYFSTFSFGFEMTKVVIDNYMNNRQPDLIIDKL